MSTRRKSFILKIHQTCNLFAVVGVIALVALGISLYSETVTLKDELVTTREAVGVLRNSIAEKKNELYQLTDFGDLENLVARLGLVKEYNPSYLQLDQGDHLGRR